MPELAEVEYYRRQWDAGLGARIVRVEWHPAKRIFHGIAQHTFIATLTGATYAGSEASAKQMLFWFTRGRTKKPQAWLGIHLGMTGYLRTEGRDFAPGVHDHLALFTARVALVLKDPRTFGRVRFQTGAEPPEWWTKLPPAVDSDEFTFERMYAFLQRRARLAVKAALLVQEMFPGVGNWMADEILWHARIDPPHTLRAAHEDAGSRALARSAESLPRSDANGRRGLFRTTGGLVFPRALDCGGTMPAVQGRAEDGDDWRTHYALVRTLPAVNGEGFHF